MVAVGFCGDLMFARLGATRKPQVMNWPFPRTPQLIFSNWREAAEKFVLARFQERREDKMSRI